MVDLLNMDRTNQERGKWTGRTIQERGKWTGQDNSGNWEKDRTEQK